MALAIILFVIFLLMHILFYLNKKLSFVQNSILFMIMAILTKNYTTIMIMQLERWKLTEDDLLFGFFLIHREVTTPLFVLLFVNIYLVKPKRFQKIALFISFLALMQGIDGLTEYFKVVEFVQWNQFLGGVVNVAYLIIGLGLAKLLLLLERRYEHGSRV